MCLDEESRKYPENTEALRDCSVSTVDQEKCQKMKFFTDLPKKDMEERGWEQVDFVYISGDAYVRSSVFRTCDHYETSGSAWIIKSGSLRSRTGKIRTALPMLGEPRLGFLVSAGNMDSMVNHYSVSKKRRQNGCLYTGRRNGKTTGLCDGGILQSDPSDYIRRHRSSSAGSRQVCARLAHYDYWSDKLKRSILLDSGADLISYGMGEHSIIEIAEALDSGIDGQ